MQGDLETTTEKLSGLLELKIEYEMRKTIIEMTKLSKQRVNAMITAVNEGLIPVVQTKKKTFFDWIFNR